MVLEPLLRDFTQKLVERARSLKVGPGIDLTVYMGPLVSEEQRQRVLGYIEIGEQESFRLLTGGHELAKGDLRYGYFVAPAVFSDVEPGMRIAQEEIFGPVVGIIRARSLDEAIEIANGVAYGLSASIVTRNIRRALHFARAIYAGVVRINLETAGAEPHVPFGGMKALVFIRVSTGKPRENFSPRPKRCTSAFHQPEHLCRTCSGPVQPVPCCTRDGLLCPYS